MKNYNNFKKIKRMIDDKNDLKKEIDGYYFNSNAIDYVMDLTSEQYFMNGYYDLTVSDILNMINDANSLEQVKYNLLKEYNEEYSNIMYDCFLNYMTKEVNTSE